MRPHTLTTGKDRIGPFEPPQTCAGQYEFDDESDAWDRNNDANSYRQPETRTLEGQLDTEPNLNERKTTLERIADAYFTPKAFEKDGKVYEFLGVKIVQKLLMSAVRKMFRRTEGMDEVAGMYFIGKRRRTRDLETFVKGTRFNEAYHLSFVPFGVYLTGEPTIQNNTLLMAMNSAILILNVGLVMLQRYNRARVYTALEHRKTRDGTYRLATEGWDRARTPQRS